MPYTTALAVAALVAALAVSQIGWRLVQVAAAPRRTAHWVARHEACQRVIQIATQAVAAYSGEDYPAARQMVKFELREAAMSLGLYWTKDNPTVLRAGRVVDVVNRLDDEHAKDPYSDATFTAREAVWTEVYGFAHTARHSMHKDDAA